MRKDTIKNYIIKHRAALAALFWLSYFQYTNTLFFPDGNMILTEGLVLQEAKIWSQFLEREIIPESNSCELYFEEPEIENFVVKLEGYYPDVKYVNKLMTHSWGQKVIRFYDPDGNLIEVGTPI